VGSKEPVEIQGKSCRGKAKIYRIIAENSDRVKKYHFFPLDSSWGMKRVWLDK
jgi:hypothetical protein